MGLFGGLGKKLKSIDWDRVSAGLSAAGATVQDDHATAAQAWGLYGQRRGERAQDAAKQAQIEAAVAALVARGVPEQEARIIAQGGSADTLLSQHNAPQSQNDSEFVRTLKMAGIDPASPEGQALARQRAQTMAMPAPQMIGSPETGYRWVTPPAPGMQSHGSLANSPAERGPQPGAIIGGFKFKGGNPNDQNNWEPVSGGAGSNAGGNFLRGFKRVPGGFSRF